jgi:glycosyltransferase involved in cell wall biosynthesis
MNDDLVLDIVIPAHNEEDRLDRTLSVYREGFPEPGVRFMVALDRCTDGTESIVRMHAAVDDRVSLYDFPKLGKGGVLMEAFRRTTAPLVGFADADCATPPSEFRRLAEIVDSEAEGAIASRDHPASILPVKRSLFRSTLTKGGQVVIKTMFRLGYNDTQCGAKVLRGDVLRSMLPVLSSRDFLFDVDLLLAARSLGHDIKEVPTVWIDQAGSKVRRSDAAKTLVSALRLWLHHRVLPVHPPH